MKRLLDWLDHRTGTRRILHEALYERIPGGARWRYVWGSTLVFTFFVQLITGVCLWTAYSPSAQTAWESVYFIQEHMTAGWLVRGLHHFSAQAMVVLLALHLIQVIWDGAYRAPREVNFWLGLILMQIVLALSLTGYLLPWDQKGYYATQVATELLGLTPLIGAEVQSLALGGTEYGHHTLTRFFALHAGILPGALIVFLALHLYVFRRHGLTVPDPHRAPETTFWPDQVLRDAVACLGVLAVVLFFTITKGAELSAPANPAEPYSAARPEWYFLFLFRFLKFEWVEDIGLSFGAIYVPGAVMAVFVLMPIIALTRRGHAFNRAFLAAMMAGVGFLTGLAMYEDARNPDHQAAVAEAERDGQRTVALGNAFGFDLDGAIGALARDPLTQGPRLFARNCSGCHRYNGHDGTGRKVVELVNGKEIEARAMAADLGRHSLREWIRSLLTDYKAHFAALQGVTYNDQDVGEAFLENGAMVDWWNGNHQTLTDKANADDLTALVEFLAAQSQRSDIMPVDAALVTRGRQVFFGGKLTRGEITACADCHVLVPLGAEEPDSDPGLGSAPVLTGYMGMEWLRKFIEDPGAEEFYGSAVMNAMPAFRERLSERDRDLLVRWLAGDYYRPTEREN